MAAVTEKQRQFIELMDSYLEEGFTGTTKEEAQAYISENIEFFKEEQRKDEAMQGIMYEECGFVD